MVDGRIVQNRMFTSFNVKSKCLFIFVFFSAVTFLLFPVILCVHKNGMFLSLIQ